MRAYWLDQWPAGKQIRLGLRRPGREKEFFCLTATKVLWGAWQDQVGGRSGIWLESPVLALIMESPSLQGRVSQGLLRCKLWSPGYLVNACSTSPTGLHACMRSQIMPVVLAQAPHSLKLGLGFPPKTWKQRRKLFVLIVQWWHTRSR